MPKIDIKKDKKLDSAFEKFIIGLRNLSKKRLELVQRVTKRIDAEKLQASSKHSDH